MYRTDSNKRMQHCFHMDVQLDVFGKWRFGRLCYLNRDFGRQKWGNEDYAREELVAEMGAAFSMHRACLHPGGPALRSRYAPVNNA